MKDRDSDLSQAVFPGMRERGAGRIITVSSLGGVIGTPFNDVYCAAKFAVEGLIKTYRQNFGQATSTPQTGEEVAQTILAAATDEKPHLRYQTSALARTLAGRKLVDPTGDAYLDLMVGMMATPPKA